MPCIDMATLRPRLWAFGFSSDRNMNCACIQHQAVQLRSLWPSPLILSYIHRDSLDCYDDRVLYTCIAPSTFQLVRLSHSRLHRLILHPFRFSSTLMRLHSTRWLGYDGCGITSSRSRILFPVSTTQHVISLRITKEPGHVDESSFGLHGR